MEKYYIRVILDGSGFQGTLLKKLRENGFLKLKTTGNADKF